jgi:hypothetical protein
MQSAKAAEIIEAAYPTASALCPACVDISPAAGGGLGV